MTGRTGATRRPDSWQCHDGTWHWCVLLLSVHQRFPLQLPPCCSGNASCHPPHVSCAQLPRKEVASGLVTAMGLLWAVRRAIRQFVACTRTDLCLGLIPASSQSCDMKAELQTCAPWFAGHGRGALVPHTIPVQRPLQVRCDCTLLYLPARSQHSCRGVLMHRVLLCALQNDLLHPSSAVPLDWGQHHTWLGRATATQGAHEVLQAVMA